MAYGEWGERFQNEWGVIIHMGEENCREGYGKADGGLGGGLTAHCRLVCESFCFPEGLPPFLGP